MTEYLRDDENQIQADLAQRIGQIAAQYSECIKATPEVFPKEKRYDITLNICLLQTLLTSCSELVKAMKGNEKKKSFFAEEFTSVSAFWGLTPEMIMKDTFVREKVVHFDVVTHLRDALSHPTIINLENDYLSTGYTTIEPINREIAKFSFISSPDVRKGHPKNFGTELEAQLQLRQPGYPPAAYVKSIDNEHRKYQIWSENAAYIRIFQINISPDGLRTLLMGLSNHLSLPIMKTWDGKTT